MPDASVLMISVGAYLPEKILTNEDLSAFVDTDDEWIRQRTGITQRHIVADGMTCPPHMPFGLPPDHKVVQLGS